MKNKVIFKVASMFFVCFFFIVSCDSSVKGEKDYFARLQVISEISNNGVGDIKRSLKLAEKLANDYPEKAEVYFFIIALKGMTFDLDKEIHNPTDEQKLHIKELIDSGEKGLNLFEKDDDISLDTTTEYAIGYAGILSNFGQYKRSVALFNKYYDLDIYLTHESMKYAVIHYANALANIDKLGEANTLYVASFNQNKNDIRLFRAFIKFQADHDTEENSASLALDYMKTYGVEEGIKYQLCQTYEQYKNFEKAVLCFQELIEFSKSNEVQSTYVKHAHDYISRQETRGVN